MPRGKETPSSRWTKRELGDWTNPSAEDFTTLVSVARYNIGPQDGLFSRDGPTSPTEYLYFDPRLVEDRRERRRRSRNGMQPQPSAPQKTCFGSILQTAATDRPIVWSVTPPPCPRPLDLPLSSVITTPDGQTIDLGARQEGETAFVAAFISPATGMDTGYRIYVRGEETYLALFRQDVLAYLAQVQWTVAPPIRRIGRREPTKAKPAHSVPLCAGFLLACQNRPRSVSPPAGGERNSNHVLTGSAGQNILLTPRVPGPARRGSGCNPQFLGGAKNQAGSLPPSYAVFPNEAQTPVPLPKFSYRNCPVFGRTASRFCSFRS